MKLKLNVVLICAWCALATNSPACINCIRLAQQGLSPDDPSGQTYDSGPAHWLSFTNQSAPNPASASTVTNALVALPKTNSPAAVTFTNSALVGFDVLAGYNITLLPELEKNTNGAWADSLVNAMIPANIQALDHRTVAVDGFMIPAIIENGKVTEFLLSRNPPACCYGGVPQIHEWVKVRVKPPGVEWEQYNTVRAHGVLRVGAERVDGALTSIYRMDAEKVEATPEH